MFLSCFQLPVTAPDWQEEGEDEEDDERPQLEVPEDIPQESIVVKIGAAAVPGLIAALGDNQQHVRWGN